MPKCGICGSVALHYRGRKVRHLRQESGPRSGKKTARKRKKATRRAASLSPSVKELQRVDISRHEEQMRDKNHPLPSKNHDWSRFLIQHSPNVLITTDAQGRIIEFNPAAERMTGYSRAEVLGPPAEEILDCQGCDLNYILNPVVGDQNEVTQEGTLRHRSGQAVQDKLTTFHVPPPLFSAEGLQFAASSEGTG